MGMDMRTKVRRFHQAKWDEPVIFELSNKGERGILVPQAEKGIEDVVGDGISKLPRKMRRKTPPKLPELSQMQVLKHYLRLSQENLGADFNVDIGQGTCTMKYSPKVNELFVRSPKVSALHPLQDQSTVQGILEILYKTDLFLREISGLDRFTLSAGVRLPGDSGYGFYCEGLSCVQGRIGATRRDHHHPLLPSLGCSGPCGPRLQGRHALPG